MEKEQDILFNDYLIKEAGAKITDFSGNPANYNTPDLLLTNGTKIHDYFLSKLKEVKYLD